MSKEVIKPEQYAKVALVRVDEDVVLNESQIAELKGLYETTIEKLKPGQLISGKVVETSNHGVIVDIQYKSDGLIPRYEFTDYELQALKPGQDIEVILDELESVDGTVVLSYEKAKSLRAWDKITQLFEEGKPVEGVVTHKVKGGLSVDIGVPAFLPGSQVDLQRVTDFDSFVGKSVTAEIIKINKKRGNVIISRRKYLSEKRADIRRKVLDTIAEGQVIQGAVKNITNYGVFVDIGGVDGLLHITDMTWGRISHPSEVVKIGDQITVKVLSIDKENNKISLGMKQLSGNPWSELDSAIQVGSKITGTISSITDYGLFVEIQKGVEGLVHISEISWTDRINDLAKHFKVGEPVEVVVISLDKDNRRMSLSIKQREQNPWTTLSEKFKVGDKIKGTVSNVTDFGVFIQLIPGVDGLAHVSDLSWTEHIDHPADYYKKGDAVEAVILAIDEANKKASLGIKQLTTDPWETIEVEYPVDSLIDNAIVTKTTSFGAFVRLPNGIEGLVHISDIAESQGKRADEIKISEVLTPGKTYKLRVTNINKEERKLGLSLNLEATGKEHKSEFKKAPRIKETVVEKIIKPKSLFQMELEKLKEKK